MAGGGEGREMLKAIQKAGAGDAGEPIVVEAWQRPEDAGPIAGRPAAGAGRFVDDGHPPAAGGQTLRNRSAGKAGADDERAAVCARRLVFRPATGPRRRAGALCRGQGGRLCLVCAAAGRHLEGRGEASFLRRRARVKRPVSGGLAMCSIDGVARREEAGIGRRDGSVHELDMRDERSGAPTGDNPAPF